MQAEAMEAEREIDPATMDTDVLVVGAGPTGLVMAAELARHGAGCRIIDRMTEPSPLSRAIALHSRSLEMFDDLGLADQIIAAGNKLLATNVYNAGEQLVHLSMNELDGPYPFILGIPQNLTESLLEKHLQGLGVSVERGTELLGIEQQSDCVRARIRNAQGQEAEIVSRWLVGCDGAHSATRKAIGLAFDGAAYEESFLLADTHLDWEMPRNAISIFLHEQGPLLVFPLVEDRWRIIGVLTDRQVPRGYKPEEAEMQELLDSRAWPGIRLHDSHWLGSFQIHHRHVDQLRQGRVFLAGDAAHIHSPVGGQGMNTSMQDAYNLAWKLAIEVRGQAAPGLLDTYQTERLQIARQLVRSTDAATRAVTLKHPLAQKLRNSMMAFLTQHEVVRQRMRNTASELAIHYPDSPLNFQRWPASLPCHAGIPAGDRMPDSRLKDASGREVRLYDLLRGPHHSLILCPGEKADTETRHHMLREFLPLLERFTPADLRCYWIADQLPNILEPKIQNFLDLNGELKQRLMIRQEACFLVRPDGYLACRSQPARADELKNYLDKVFS